MNVILPIQVKEESVLLTGVMVRKFERNLVHVAESCLLGVVGLYFHTKRYMYPVFSRRYIIFTFTISLMTAESQL